MKPDFIGIGAQRCGTTWIYAMLSEHPNVCLSARKEIDFFSHNFDRGYQWYESQFDCSNMRPVVVGEISPSYLGHREAPERVAAYQPAARLIVALRDPVERLISNYRHDLRAGNIRGGELSIEEAISNNPTYLTKGLYARHLRRWLDFFPREQLHVVFNERMATCPHEVVEGLYEFIGVNAGFRPQTRDTRENRSYRARSRAVASWVNTGARRMREWGMTPLWSRLVRNRTLRRAYQALNVAPEDGPSLEVGSREQERLRAYFDPEVADLERLLDVDLSEWRADAGEHVAVMGE